MCYKTTHTAKPFQEQLKKDLPLQENGQEVTRILFEHFLVKTDFFELEFFQVFNFVFSEFCYIFMKNWQSYKEKLFSQILNSRLCLIFLNIEYLNTFLIFLNKFSKHVVEAVIFT